jgi:tRNA (guanine37-N1)-methyltransferase
MCELKCTHHKLFLGITVPEATCLKVPKNYGEKAIHLVRKLKILNQELKMHQIEDKLCIPLTNEPSPENLEEIRKNLLKFEISKHNLSKQKKRHFTHLELLADNLPTHLLTRVPRAMDFIGDMAIVEIPKELSTYKKSVGEAILKSHKQTKTVLTKSSAVEGVYRLRDFEIIAGEKKTATVYREYGCVYYVDVAKAYFSPRLSTEHNRIASQVKNGETVLDMFAGVGPFAIPIAKKYQNVRVYAIDLNIDAVSLLKRNIAVNRVEKQIVPILGDTRQVITEQLSGMMDRVIMNLPETALEFLDVACKAIKPEGGIIHYYSFVNASNPLEKAKVRLTEAVSKNNRKVQKLLLVKTVREVAPYTWQVVVDAKIQ